MERRSFLSAFTVASLGAALQGAFIESARAQIVAPVAVNSPGQPAMLGEFPQASTIILVHAAWADGSCWSNIILPLEQRGLNVICAPTPPTSLRNAAAVLSGPTDRPPGPVVLVGHAYSGAGIA